MRLLGRASLIALCLWLPTVSVEAIEIDDASGARVDAVWYADGSCRLSVDGEETVGVTGIVADMGKEGARTMVHCDGENGLRITLMALGDGLALGERVVLADPADIDTAVNGSVAWLSRPIPEVPTDQLHRRFVIDGRIMIHATPIVDTAESTLYVDKLPFAEIHGWLAPLQEPLEGGTLAVPLPDATGSAGDVDPDRTKLACRVIPCWR